MASIDFAVRIGIPGSLTIEVQQSQGLGGQASVLRAPLDQGLLGGSGIGSSAPAGQSSLISTAWGKGWATPMTNRLTALGGNSGFQLISFEAPSWDQTDKLWGAQGSIDGTTDPVTVIAPLFGTSVYGRQFQAGDYILWNDPSVAAGLYQYEIDQITSVSGSTFTLARRAQGGMSGRAQFNSVMVPHSNVKFYQLIDRTFFDLWMGEHQVFKFLWDQMIVAAVSAMTLGLQSPSVQNLFPAPPAAANPGLST